MFLGAYRFASRRVPGISPGAAPSSLPLSVRDRSIIIPEAPRSDLRTRASFIAMNKRIILPPRRARYRATRVKRKKNPVKRAVKRRVGEMKSLGEKRKREVVLYQANYRGSEQRVFLSFFRQPRARRQEHRRRRIAARDYPSLNKKCRLRDAGTSALIKLSFFSLYLRYLSSASAG